MSERMTNFLQELNASEIRALRAENARLRDEIGRLKVSEAVYGAEADRLREAIRRIAEQDATLSVQGGNVIVDVTDEKVVRLPSTFTASNVGGWVILALADSLNAAGVKWEVAEE